MADNATGVGAASTSYTFATDEIGGAHYQRVKLTWGVDGTATDASATNPLPIVIDATSLAALESITATSTLAAGTAYAGQVGTELSTSAIRDGATSLTPKFASISAATSGDNLVVAAVVGKKVRVLSYVLVADGAVTAKFQSDATDLTGAMSFAANGGVSVPFSPVGHFETAVNTVLQLNLGGAVGVRGHLTYVEV